MILTIFICLISSLIIISTVTVSHSSRGDKRRQVELLEHKKVECKVAVNCDNNRKTVDSLN